MAAVFWDASALAKRYAVEVGSDTADALFAALQPSQMITTVWGYAETFSILLRSFNRGRLDRATFVTAVSALKQEIIDHPDLGFLAVEDAAVLAGLPLMRRHNLNVTDATLLAVLLRYTQAQPPAAPRCVLVAADHRLLRAAEVEGVPVLNPEQVGPADVPSLFAQE
jgi:predicted nucleic acid-binding protein